MLHDNLPTNIFSIVKQQKLWLATKKKQDALVTFVLISLLIISTLFSFTVRAPDV